MLPLSTLEEQPELYIGFIKDKTLNINNQLKTVKDSQKKREAWSKVKGDRVIIFSAKIITPSRSCPLCFINSLI